MADTKPNSSEIPNPDPWLDADTGDTPPNYGPRTNKEDHK